MVNIQIANSEHTQFHGFQFFCANQVFFRLLWCVMPATVKFNNQTCLRTIEICDIISNRFLPLETHGISSQKVIPELSLPWRHVFSQCFCKRDIRFVVVFHGLSLRLALRRSTSLVRGGFGAAQNCTPTIHRKTYRSAPLTRFNKLEVVYMYYLGNSLSAAGSATSSVFNCDQHQPISADVKYSKFPVEDFTMPFFTVFPT